MNHPKAGSTKINPSVNSVFSGLEVNSLEQLSVLTFWTRMGEAYRDLWTKNQGVIPSDLWTAYLLKIGKKASMLALVEIINKGGAFPPTLPEFAKIGNQKARELKNIPPLGKIVDLIITGKNNRVFKSISESYEYPIVWEIVKDKSFDNWDFYRSNKKDAMKMVEKTLEKLIEFGFKDTFSKSDLMPPTKALSLPPKVDKHVSRAYFSEFRKILGVE